MNAPMDQGELCQAVRDLWKIDQAGLLDQFHEDLAHELRREPPEDAEHCTIGQSIAVSEWARTAMRLFGVSEPDAAAASEGALLRTRRRITLDLIAEYRERIGATTPATNTEAGVPAAIERARRGHA